MPPMKTDSNVQNRITDRRLICIGSIQDSNQMDSSYNRGINHKTSPAYRLDVRLPPLCLLAGEITTAPQSLALLAANATKI